MELNEFIDYCNKGFCIRKLMVSKNCKRLSKQTTCFNKFNKSNQDAYDKMIAGDEKWNEVRTFIRNRDGNRCQLWKILTIEEKKYIINNFKSDYIFLSNLDCAHIHGRGTHPELKYDPGNIVLMRRFFHGRLDKYEHPITGKRITKEERIEWLKKAKNGE